MENPYNDTSVNTKTFYRTFSYNVDPSKLVWHRDHNNRIIKVIEGCLWHLQMDNELPLLLEINKQYHIPKNVYHRIIKGYGNLIIEVRE